MLLNLGYGADIFGWDDPLCIVLDFYIMTMHAGFHFEKMISRRMVVCDVGASLPRRICSHMGSGVRATNSGEDLTAFACNNPGISV